jgi:hypothetical protein
MANENIKKEIEIDGLKYHLDVDTVSDWNFWENLKNEYSETGMSYAIALVQGVFGDDYEKVKKACTNEKGAIPVQNVMNFLVKAQKLGNFSISPT